jgi:hypothetical protein
MREILEKNWPKKLLAGSGGCAVKLLQIHGLMADG